MKNRPQYFALYSIALFLTAVSIPLQIALLQDLAITDIVLLWKLMNPINAALVITLFAASVLALRVSPALKWTLPLVIGLMALNNFMVAMNPVNYNPQSAHLASLLFLALHAPMLLPKSRSVLLNHRLRWWLVPQRKLMEIPVCMKTLQGFRFTARTFDVSERGIFVNLDPKIFDPANNNFLKALLSGSRMNIRLTVNRFRDVECQAKVVRTQHSKRGHYPSGIGIQFLDLNKESLADIQKAMHYRGADTGLRI